MIGSELDEVDGIQEDGTRVGGQWRLKDGWNQVLRVLSDPRVHVLEDLFSFSGEVDVVHASRVEGVEGGAVGIEGSVGLIFPLNQQHV